MEKYKVIVIVIVIVALLILALVKRFVQGGLDGRWPYHAKRVLTNTEQILYYRLLKALPDCVVLAQVGLSRIIGVNRGVRFYQWFNKISQMSIDYVICSKDFNVLAAIELDDATHNKSQRIKADRKKDKALMSAGIKIIRWKVNQMPDERKIREALNLKPLIKS
ncbi:MAG: DUF2726 domain-containing protein [Candidatus Accumulibacter sp.]|jgi:hypothetical protein|nr:DUF2726 domain-containing protein [Accumulibacter sp.]